MVCQSTPTATLEGTSLISSNIVSTSVYTELRVVSDSPVVISTCVPTTVGNSSTCAPNVVTSPGGPDSTSTILYTTVVTVPVVQTVRTPTQTLFAPCNSGLSPRQITSGNPGPGTVAPPPPTVNDPTTAAATPTPIYVTPTPISVTPDPISVTPGPISVTPGPITITTGPITTDIITTTTTTPTTNIVTTTTTTPSPITTDIITTTTTTPSPITTNIVTTTTTTPSPITTDIVTTTTTTPSPTSTADPGTATSTTTVGGGTTTSIAIVPQTPNPTTPTPTPSSSTITAQAVSRSIYTSTGPNGVVTTVTFDVVPTPDQGSSSTPNTAAIVGGVVGGVVGLIILIGIIWRIAYKRRSGRWDDTWEEDEAHRAGQAEIEPAHPAFHDNSSSPNPYVYGAIGRRTPSRSDQASATRSYSRTNSTATGYADHTRTSSEAPLMFSTSPPHSPANLQPPQLHGSGTPVWASASAQQGYFPQGYPPIPSDPNFAPTVTPTYHVPPTQTGANSAMAYPPGAAPPVIGGRRGTYNEYHKPPLEPSLQGATRPPSQHNQSRRGSTSASFMDAPVDHKAEFHPLPLPPGAMSVHTPSIRDRKDRLYEKGGLDVPPMNPDELPRRTSPAPSKAPSHAPIFEEGPPGYRQWQT